MTLKNWTIFGCGVMVGLAAMALPSADFSAPRLEAAAAEQKYENRIVLENELVRVREVTFPAGVADTGMHTHDLAHVGVILTPGSLRFTDPGGQVDVVEFTAGSVGFREANATHMVAAAGDTPMRVIEVEIKRP